MTDTEVSEPLYYWNLYSRFKNEFSVKAYNYLKNVSRSQSKGVKYFENLEASITDHTVGLGFAFIPASAVALLYVFPEFVLAMLSWVCISGRRILLVQVYVIATRMYKVLIIHLFIVPLIGNFQINYSLNSICLDLARARILER